MTLPPRLGGRTLRGAGPAWAVCAALGALLAACACLGFLQGSPQRPLLPWWILVALLLGTLAAPINLGTTDTSNRWRMPEIVTVIAWFSLSPAQIFALWLGCRLLFLPSSRGQMPLRRCFNVILWTTTATAGAVAFRLVADPTRPMDATSVAGILLGIAVLSLDTVMVPLVIDLYQGGHRWSQWLPTAAIEACTHGASAALGLLAVILWRAEPRGILLLIVPSLVLRRAFIASLRDRARAATFGHLLRASQSLQPNAPGGGLPAAVDALRAAFGAAHAQLVVVSATPDAPNRAVAHRFVVGGAQPTEQGSTLAPGESELLEAMGGRAEAVADSLTLPAAAAVARLHGARRVLAAALTSPSGDTGLLLLLDNERSVRWSAADKALLATSAAQLAAAIERDRLTEMIASAAVDREHLEHRATHDPLTGLANRRGLDRCLEDAVAAGAHDVSILFIDLDDFKAVNDELGHAAGDVVLCTVGDRLRDAARGGDLVARVGGDEFAVVLVGAGATDAAVHAANRIVRVLAEPITTAFGVAQVGASVGAAPLEQGMTAADLLSHADAAMYTAKRKGKGRACAWSA